MNIYTKASMPCKQYIIKEECCGDVAYFAVFF